MHAPRLSCRLGLLPTLAALALSLAACAGPSNPGPTATGGAPTGKPKVDRLVLMVNPPPNEFNDVRKICCFDVYPMRPMYENLVGIDAKTGKYTPQLATEWKLEPDNNGEIGRAHV